MDMKLPENNGPTSTPNGIQSNGLSSCSPLKWQFSATPTGHEEREAKIRVLECQVFSPPYVQPGV